MSKNHNLPNRGYAIDDVLQPGRLLRVNQIVGHILPISRSYFLAKVKQGKFPQPVKLSERITYWKSEDMPFPQVTPHPVEQQEKHLDNLVAYLDIPNNANQSSSSGGSASAASCSRSSSMCSPQ
jgi:predicted DNA-binding transcriptional regulator AlpA